MTVRMQYANYHRRNYKFKIITAECDNQKYDG